MFLCIAYLHCSDFYFNKLNVMSNISLKLWLAFVLQVLLLDSAFWKCLNFFNWQCKCDPWSDFAEQSFKVRRWKCSRIKVIVFGVNRFRPQEIKLLTKQSFIFHKIQSSVSMPRVLRIFFKLQGGNLGHFLLRDHG